MAKATTERISALLRPPAGAIDLHGVDTRATPGFDGGKAKATKAQAKTAEWLSTLQEQLYAEGRSGGSRSVLLVLQGMDTSGKGGTVRHVVGQCDPSGVHVATFGRPTPEELEHDFLWRIRRQLPKPGKVGVFDRSHYEDVLAARVRAVVDRRTWGRRYKTINRFRRGARRGRHTRRQVLPAHLRRGATQAAARAPRRPDEALEVQPGRPRGPRPVGRLHGRLRRRARALQHGERAMARRARRPQVVPQLGDHPAADRGDGGPGARLVRGALRRRRGAPAARGDPVVRLGVRAGNGNGSLRERSRGAGRPRGRILPLDAA